MRQIRTLAVGYSDGVRLPPHAHAWHQLVFASGGVVHVQAERQLWVVPPQRAVWVPAHCRHTLTMRGFVALRTLYVPTTLDVPGAEAGRVLAVGELLRALIVRCTEIGIVDPDVEPSHAPLLDLTLHELTRAPALDLELPMPTDPAARRLARRLCDDPADPASLDELSRHVGASKRTLERRFVAQTGMSFGAWRTALRLRASLHLLAAGTPVTDTAVQVGYDSPSAYVAAFRKAMGVTPGAYARASRSGPGS